LKFILDGYATEGCQHCQIHPEPENLLHADAFARKNLPKTRLMYLLTVRIHLLSILAAVFTRDLRAPSCNRMLDMSGREAASGQQCRHGGRSVHSGKFSHITLMITESDHGSCTAN